MHYREFRFFGSLSWMWWCDNGHDGDLPLDANLAEHALIHEVECHLQQGSE